MPNVAWPDHVEDAYVSSEEAARSSPKAAAPLPAHPQCPVPLHSRYPFAWAGGRCEASVLQWALRSLVAALMSVSRGVGGRPCSILASPLKSCGFKSKLPDGAQGRRPLRLVCPPSGHALSFLHCFSSRSFSFPENFSGREF